MMAVAEISPTESASTDAAKPIIPLKHRVDVTITETHDGWEATAVLANPTGTIHSHGTHEGKDHGSTPSGAAAAAINAALLARVEANRHGCGDDESSKSPPPIGAASKGTQSGIVGERGCLSGTLEPVRRDDMSETTTRTKKDYQAMAEGARAT